MVHFFKFIAGVPCQAQAAHLTIALLGQSCVAPIEATGHFGMKLHITFNSNQDTPPFLFGVPDFNPMLVQRAHVCRDQAKMFLQNLRVSFVKETRQPKTKCLVR